MRKLSYLVVILMTMILVACSGVQVKWDSLTPDQQGRVIVSNMQKQLDTSFATGKTYIAANPQYTEQWKTKAIPAFDIANKAIGKYINMAKMGKALTPDAVYAEMTPLMAAVTDALVKMGALK